MKAQDTGDYRKKKGMKKSQNVPLSELGFKSKVYYGIETQYTRKRMKYKAARYGAQNSKQCFMGRLTFIVDPNTLNHDQLQALPNFKGITKHEWQKVKQIIYHSREELSCAICLQKQFVAPQMTNCGHVFCWHCIYMHHYKCKEWVQLALKANNCPVCNEVYLIDSLVTCKHIYGRSFQQLENNRIKLALKCRPEGDKKVYNSNDHKEDLNFARVVKSTSQKIVEIYQLQKEELQKFYSICDDEQTKSWVAKIFSLSYQKIEKATLIRSKRQYKLHKNEYKINGLIATSLQQKVNTINFYQQHSGKFIFLHPLCDKFLRKSKNQLPIELQQQIIEWQEVEYNIDMARRYKQLSHIVQNQQIDLVIVNMKQLVPQAEYKQFQMELQQCKLRKQQQLEREQKQSERLQAIYQNQKEYIKKLKKMQESQFYDIKVPTTINLNELGNNDYFPSLIQTKSLPDPQTKDMKIVIEQTKPKEKKKVVAVQLQQGDFPGLVPLKAKQQAVVQIQKEAPKLIFSKSEEPKLNSSKNQQQEFPGMNEKNNKNQQAPKFQKKNSRKKKEKFINVTDQFFQRKEDQVD